MARSPREKFFARLKTTPEYRVLSTLINDSVVTPAQAVQEIVAMTELLKAGETRALGHHFYDTACSILELAGRATSEESANLVDLILCLHEITILDPSTDRPLAYDGDLVWRQLPTFGYTFVDEICAYNPLDPNKTAAEQTIWENLTGFFAQLTARSNAGDVYTDFSSWALTAFHYAFGPFLTTEEVTENAIQAACIWFIYAAERLWLNTMDDKRLDWSQNKWDDWKMGLSRTRERATSDSTRRLIDGALTKIRQAEDWI